MATFSEISSNFIYNFVAEDISKNGRFFGKTVHTRFPPEPNGYLHIGHAKAICINFNVAEKFGGICNLRMDDTNPIKENIEYIEAIKNDVKWLGFDWQDRFFYASDYFEKMFECACLLIKKGLAYICELTPEEVKKNRGDLKNSAISPYRDRPREKSLGLFHRMKNGEFENEAMTLRAKIDLNSGNFNMRDPVIYRISKNFHHRTKNNWSIYPMYDFAHPIEDAIENITHSLCSLEFEDHRPLYEWVINNIDFAAKPRQIEFARLNMNYTVMSKRKLKRLVDEKIVDGWDDPRMPTISGLRRRGFTPSSIRTFCQKIGVSKAVSTVDYEFLKNCLREELNFKAKRAMAILHPIKLIITNYPENEFEKLEIENNPNNASCGNRKVRFSKELFIENDDFFESPPKKYFRLFVGNKVRLKSAYVVICTGFKKDENGNILAVYAEYLPETKGGKNPDGQKIKSTIHWVEKSSAITAEIRLYDNLFNCENPESDETDYIQKINPNSLIILKNCKLEAALSAAKLGEYYQFLRNGYFCLDKDSNTQNLIFNKCVSLKESFKI